MAYMNQELKKELAPKIKSILDKYGLKGSLSVRHHSKLVLTIRQGKIDFITNYNEHATMRHYHEKTDCLDVNTYWYMESFSGKALEFLSEVIPAMNIGNHDNSDIMTDYFDVGWYIDVRIGDYDTPYKLIS